MDWIIVGNPCLVDLNVSTCLILNFHVNLMICDYIYNRGKKLTWMRKREKIENHQSPQKGVELQLYTTNLKG